MSYKCEQCGEEEKTEFDLEVKHRSCRLKAAFPGAYTERGDGLVSFDMGKVAQSLGLFKDVVLGRDGQPLHPLDGDVHFRISAGWVEPEIWIEMPVQVGNQVSSFSYRITIGSWIELNRGINSAIELAWQHIREKKQM